MFVAIDAPQLLGAISRDVFDLRFGKVIMTGVDCNNMCYMSKPSENAKFSRIFDDSSPQKV